MTSPVAAIGAQHDRTRLHRVGDQALLDVAALEDPAALGGRLGGGGGVVAAGELPVVARVRALVGVDEVGTVGDGRRHVEDRRAAAV